jgi:transcription initiation factor TFIIE subunit alpha
MSKKISQGSSVGGVTGAKKGKADVKSTTGVGVAAAATAGNTGVARIPNPNAKFLTNKFVQDYLLSSFGENSIRIIKAANTEMTDEALAAKCKLKVSEIRALLNKLHNLRLAEYTRIRDKDTGWYSYVWRVNLEKIYDTLEEQMKSEMKNLEMAMEESATVLSFYCPKCSKENKIDFDTATQIGFTCPNCKKRLTADKQDMQTILEQLEALKKKYSEFKTSINQNIDQ